MAERRETTPWALLAQDQSPRTYAPGQLIYLQGTEADTFFYLLSGSARSYISSETGDERVLTTHRSGDLMGEAAFFDGCPRVSSAVAVTECRAVSIDRERLDRVLRAHPELALPMTWTACPSARRTSGWPGTSSPSPRSPTAPCAAPTRRSALPWG